MTPTPERSAPEAQLHPHGARRVELPGPWGPLAALRTEPGGPAPEDVVAVLVPGYTGSKEDFAPLLDPLAGAGIGALAVDLPGQYESPGSDREGDHGVERLGEVVAALVRAETAPGRAVMLLGHSYGGLVARAAVLSGAPVTGLTLLGSGPAALPMGSRRTRLDLTEPVLRRRGPAELVAELAARGEWDGSSAPLAAFLRRRLAASSPAALLGAGDALRREPDRVAALRSAARARGLGVLVVGGTDDDAWPIARQREMAERLHAEFAAIPAAAHAPNTENPAGLLDVLVPTWRTWAREAILER